MINHARANKVDVVGPSDDEVTEVFGKAAPALDTMGFLNTPRGIWVDMEHAAKKRNWERLHKLNQRSGKLNRPSGINPGAFFFAYRSPRQISSSTRSSCSR